MKQAPITRHVIIES